jgi:hypothetical protein
MFLSASKWCGHPIPSGQSRWLEQKRRRLGRRAMKCDLCRKEEAAGNLLCKDCAEVIARLIAMKQRTERRERCAAERLEASPAHAVAPGRR